MRSIGQTEKIKRTLLKKAVGFEKTEIMKEFSVDKEGRETLVRRKVQRRYFPPDLQAMRAYLELGRSDKTEMTDEELAREKARLLRELEREDREERERIKRRDGETGRYVKKKNAADDAGENGTARTENREERERIKRRDGETGRYVKGKNAADDAGENGTARTEVRAKRNKEETK